MTDVLICYSRLKNVGSIVVVRHHFCKTATAIKALYTGIKKHSELLQNVKLIHTVTLMILIACITDGYHSRLHLSGGGHMHLHRHCVSKNDTDVALYNFVVTIIDVSKNQNNRSIIIT